MENRGGSQFFEPFKREGYEKNDRTRGSVTKGSTIAKGCFNVMFYENTNHI